MLPAAVRGDLTVAVWAEITLYPLIMSPLQTARMINLNNPDNIVNCRIKTFGMIVEVIEEPLLGELKDTVGFCPDSLQAEHFINVGIHNWRFGCQKTRFREMTVKKWGTTWRSCGNAMQGCPTVRGLITIAYQTSLISYPPLSLSLIHYR